MNSDSDYDESEDNGDIVTPIVRKCEAKPPTRKSVSAESYGVFNRKNFSQSNSLVTDNTTPKNIPSLTDRIRKRLAEVNFFSYLDESNKLDIFNSMEECHFKPGTVVIKQGDEGTNMYCVDVGRLSCYKQVKPTDTSLEYVKTY